MKNILLIVLLLLNLSSRSQANDSLPETKFELGFTFSPDYSYRVLKTAASDRWMQDTYDTLEVAKYGYTTGLNLIYRITQDVFLSSGVLFSDKGEKTKAYTIKPVNNYHSHYYYLDVPLKAGYCFTAEKVRFFLTAGVSANVYLNGRANTEVVASGEKRSLDLSPDISRVNFAFIGGLGLDCQITPRWYFKLEPNYRRSLTPVAATAVKKYFYSAGLNLGLFWRI